MTKTQRVLANVCATMRMEGMPLQESDKRRLMACLSGQQSFEQNVHALVAKHTRKAVQNCDKQI